MKLSALLRWRTALSGSRQVIAICVVSVIFLFALEQHTRSRFQERMTEHFYFQQYRSEDMQQTTEIYTLSLHDALPI